MKTKREIEIRKLRLERMARGESFLHERLTIMHDELGLLMRSLDRLVMPRVRRRRSARKTFVSKNGNVVTFPPKGDQ